MPTGHVTGHMGPTTAPPSSHCVIIVPKTPYLLSREQNNQLQCVINGIEVYFISCRNQWRIQGATPIKNWSKKKMTAVRGRKFRESSPPGQISGSATEEHICLREKNLSLNTSMNETISMQSLVCLVKVVLFHLNIFRYTMLFSKIVKNR